MMKKVLSFLKSNPLLIVILLVGLYFRVARLTELFFFGHDQDLAGWFVRDILESHHLRLIGQETSAHGVYIGPAWYYAVTVFYALFGMAPTSGIIVSVLCGLVTIASIYFVGTQIFSKRVGLISSFIYAVSFVLIMTDREVNPTISVVLWSVWFLYSLQLFLTKKTRYAMALTAFLFAFSWNINLALILLVPVSFLALVLSKQFPKVVALRDSLVVGALTLSPFLLFEVKNNFLQTKAILGSAASKAAINFPEKLDRTTTLLSKNIRNIYSGDFLAMGDKTAMLVMLALFIFLLVTRKLRLKWALLWSVWVVLYVVFFSRNPLNLSEYYLNGMTILWVLIPSLIIDFLWKKIPTRILAISLLIILFVASLIRFETIPVNRSGYVDRSAIIHEIKLDALRHGYPCTAISYITTPGNNLGYRYLIYYEGLHVNLPKSEAPVYTIVFPHSMVDHIDKSFGALGLIYPDYNKYTGEGISKSCEGENQNLTEPMFGFVK